jgi:hypothetical protein
MTYALGWKVGEAVYLAADTAVTSFAKHPYGQSRSTFGGEVLNLLEKGLGCTFA